MCFSFKVEFHVLLNTEIYSNCEKSGCVCLDCHVMLMKHKVVYRVDTSMLKLGCLCTFYSSN